MSQATPKSAKSFDFLLQAEGGLSLDDIATTQGVGRETVKSRLRYARNHLREVLKDMA